MFLEILEKMECYAREHNIPIMQKEGISFLTQYLESHECCHILEIGSAIGYSAINMAFVREDIQITTIERDETCYQEALENIKNLGLENRIQVIYGDALEVQIEGEYDFLFIDAAKSQYQKFFEKFTPLLKKGGVVITDNLKFHGLVEQQDRIESKNLRQMVQKIRIYIEFLKENPEFETEFINMGDGISISTKL